MLINFCKILSLKNLHSNLGGQIATLLTLMMVVILVLIMVTINIGQTAMNATLLANAADSATLSLASNIASKANYLKNTLKESAGEFFSNSSRQACYPTGMLGAFTSLGGAGLGGLLGSLGGPLGFVIGAVTGGTVGGAVGGAIVQESGEGALQGALSGFITGAAMGGGVVAGGYLGSTLGLLAGASQAGLVMGVASGAGLASASSLYISSAQESMRKDAFTAAAKQLKGLPERLQLEQSAILQAFAQTVDDPNKIQDFWDSDFDGNRQEEVPVFQLWWRLRSAALKGRLDILLSTLDNFINGPLTNFKDFSQAQYTPPQGFLSREEIEGSDGAMVELARFLYPTAYKLSKLTTSQGIVPLWEPGPTRPELENWINSGCPNEGGCNRPPPPGYDEIDFTIDLLTQFVETANLVIDPDQNGVITPEEINQRRMQWEQWLGDFYDPEDSDDYYDKFETLINGDNEDFKGLSYWRFEISEQKRKLPECEFDPTGTITNLPCHQTLNNGFTLIGTIDQDLSQADDEFEIARDKIQNLIEQIELFQANVKNVYEILQNATANALPSMLSGLLTEILSSFMPDHELLNAAFSLIDFGTGEAGGVNPATYKWRDSRGEHSIRVKVLIPFAFPKIRSKETGNFLKGANCLVLKNYRGLVAVDITRYDPANIEIKPGRVTLGRWNLTSADKFSLRRASVAYYSDDWVGMVGKGQLLNLFGKFFEGLEEQIRRLREWFQEGGSS